ncbi:MAG: 3-deoxy-7-phosphoheptulonate synthase [Phycisphaerales bacterium]|nr:MAG: 3-deoxy-7-phosphoheptulonate synthase [Phycisphaerales bacterium]
MLILMRTTATDEEVDQVCRAVEASGLKPHPIPGRLRTAIGVTGNTGSEGQEQFAQLRGVTEVIRVTKPYKLTGREMKPEDTVVRVGPVEIGNSRPVMIAGPCSVESRQQTVGTAQALRGLGADMLRGGCFKPRTSPYSFQGLGRQGLEILVEARDQTGLPVVSEALTTETFDLVEEAVDVIQIGARNMQNFSLLKRAGMSDKPVLLKRSMSATLEELLLAAEYVMSEGNPNVILCERGIRTFSEHCRFTLDIGIIPVLKQVTHLPIIVDPSHAAGRRDIVIPLSRAAIAAGADGLIVEVHPDPNQARSDGPQALTLDQFEQLVDELGMIIPAVPRCEGVQV